MFSASRGFLEFATPSRHKISLDRPFDFRCIRNHKFCLKTKKA